MKKDLKINLPPADDLFPPTDGLFTTQAQRDDAKLERVMNIPLHEISDFPNHPFKVKMDAEMQEMAQSVKQYGVLVPGLVRPKEGGGYEMVAGHRRKMASGLAERSSMSCIVRKLSDEEATIIMVDSNLQREKILPSEKAFAYKMKLEAMNRQGQRTDLTSTPVVSKLRTNEKIGHEAGDSREQVRRYVRLTNLIPQLLDMVDNSVIREKGTPQIAMRQAVELSYLPPEQQQTLLETIEAEECTPSHEQAIKMRTFSEAGKLNEGVIISIMQEEKPNQVEQFKIPRAKISRFFPEGTSTQKMEDTIVRALEQLRQRERNREAR